MGASSIVLADSVRCLTFNLAAPLPPGMSSPALLFVTPLAALVLSAMVTAWVAWAASLSPPLSGGIAVVVTAALLPAPLGSVQDVPPDQCPVGSHSCVFLCCRAVLSDQGSNASVPAIRSTA